MNTEQTYLDLGTIENLASFLSEEKLKALFNSYLVDSENILSSLVTVIAENNVKEAIRLVHSLKSTSANVGAILFSEMAKSLEQIARDAKLDDLHSQLDALNNLFNLTRQAIKQLEIMKAD